MVTLFEQIINGDIPADRVFENGHILAIKDTAPVAPVHLLIITKKAIPSLRQLEEEEIGLLGEIVKVAQQLAQQFGISQGYRLVTNVGSPAGQSIFHLHFHLIGGAHLGPIG